MTSRIRESCAVYSKFQSCDHQYPCNQCLAEKRECWYEDTYLQTDSSARTTRDKALKEVSRSKDLAGLDIQTKQAIAEKGASQGASRGSGSAPGAAARYEDSTTIRELASR